MNLINIDHLYVQNKMNRPRKVDIIKLNRLFLEIKADMDNKNDRNNIHL